MCFDIAAISPETKSLIIALVVMTRCSSRNSPIPIAHSTLGGRLPCCVCLFGGCDVVPFENLVDSLQMRLIGDALQYVAIVEYLDVIPSLKTRSALVKARVRETRA
jgi:hypothetical protein